MAHQCRVEGMGGNGPCRLRSHPRAGVPVEGRLELPQVRRSRCSELISPGRAYLPTSRNLRVPLEQPHPLPDPCRWRRTARGQKPATVARLNALAQRRTRVMARPWLMDRTVLAARVMAWTCTKP